MLKALYEEIDSAPQATALSAQEEKQASSPPPRSLGRAAIARLMSPS